MVNTILANNYIFPSVKCRYAKNNFLYVYTNFFVITNLIAQVPDICFVV